jgi:N-acetylgalactosamine-6-phosphate deacetylase
VVNADGKLAGSTLLLDRAVRNLVAFTGCSEAEAIAAASKNPLAVLGIDKIKDP